MTPKSSPDWLPSGWSVQFRVQKTGRKIEYYLNSNTGQKFFSKNELIQHLRIGNPQRSEPQSTSGQSSSSVKSPHVQTAVRANGDRDWLPNGWVVEVKTYRKGPRTGVHYTTYLDPSKRFRLHSKPEVLRYLKNPKKESSISGQEKHESPICNQEKQESPIHDQKKQESPASNQEKQESPASNQEKRDSPVSNQEKQESLLSKPDEHPEWLPDGWVVELKTFQKGPKAGRHYATYVDLSTRSRFYSKPEVLRYLKKAKQENSISDQKKPESFISNQGKQEGPIIDEEKQESPIPDQEMHESLVSNQEKPESPVSYQEKQESSVIDKEKQENPISDQEMQGIPVYNQGKQENPLWDQEKQESSICSQEKQESPISNQVRIEKNASDDDLPPGWIKKVKIRKSTKKKDPYYTSPVTDYVFRSKLDVFRFLETGNISKHAYLSKKWSTANQAGVDIETSPLPAAKVHSHEKGTEKISNAKSNDSSYSSREKDSELSHRSSKRLAGAEPELVGLDFALENVTRSSKNKADTMRILAKEERQHLENNCGMETTHQASTVVTTQASSDPCLKPLAKRTSRKEEEHNLPRRSSRRLATTAPDAGINSLSSERVPVPAAGNSCSTEAARPLSLASENLEGDSSNATSLIHQGSSIKSKEPIKGHKAVAEKTHKEKSELQSSFPFANSLSDPCLEFAIKTLTGAIPLEDAVNDRLVSAPDANILPATKLGEITVQSGNGEKTMPNTRKYKKMKKNKELNLPRRSSKRLAELVSESDVDSLFSKKARNSCIKEKTVEDAEKLANVSFGGHDPGTIGLRHDSARTATALPQELPTKSEELPRGDTFYASEWIKVDDEKLSENKSEPELRSPPSLEFAVKTLKGTSLEDAATKWLVFGPTNFTQEKTTRGASSVSAQKVTTPQKSYKSKAGKQKELDLPCQSSKQHSKQATELVMNSLPTESTRRNSCDEKGKEPLQAQTEGAPSDQCQKPEAEKLNNEKSKPQSLFPSGDSWGDPCLEFAFKTLTGAIAVEDNGTVQNYFQQQLDTSTTKKDGNVTYPDLNLPNFFNADISQQQVNMNPPGIPPANASFLSASGISPQKSFMEIRNCPRK